jgi:hypothetical protein
MQLRALDLDKTQDCYKNVVGLDEVGRTGDGRVMLKRYAFTIRTGHQLQIYCDVELARKFPPIKNPDIWHEQPRGMRATRLDHFCSTVPGSMRRNGL